MYGRRQWHNENQYETPDEWHKSSKPKILSLIQSAPHFAFVFSVLAIQKHFKTITIIGQPGHHLKQATKHPTISHTRTHTKNVSSDWNVLIWKVLWLYISSLHLPHSLSLSLSLSISLTRSHTFSIRFGNDFDYTLYGKHLSSDTNSIYFDKSTFGTHNRNAPKRKYIETSVRFASK